MRIIITENQKYVLRRLQQFIDIVEEQIDGYERNEDNVLQKEQISNNNLLCNKIPYGILKEQ